MTRTPLFMRTVGQGILSASGVSQVSLQAASSSSTLTHFPTGDKIILLHIMNVATPSWFDPLHDNLDRVWNAGFFMVS
jgi:hypothetical protein